MKPYFSTVLGLDTVCEFKLAQNGLVHFVYFKQKSRNFMKQHPALRTKICYIIIIIIIKRLSFVQKRLDKHK